LASDYSSGPPGVGEEGETKFALTSEAGLNDGLAYPFIALGLMLAGSGAASMPDLARWALVDVFWNVAGAVIVGVALGYMMVRVNALLPSRRRLSASKSGMVAVGLAFLAYALAGYAHANGFIAVFCEAVAIRNLTSGLDYSRQLDHTAGQFERVAMGLVLALLGVSLVRGLLAHIEWGDVAFGAVALLVVRPIAVGIGFIGSRDDRWTRAALSYFGLRGIASLYYAAVVSPQLDGAVGRQLTTVIGLVIVASVVFYGMTAHAVASRLTGGEDEFAD
jgi:NhaP-type Na+/H+ or K+/H+ antiporter